MSDDSFEAGPSTKWGWLAAIGITLAAVAAAQFVAAGLILSLGWDLNNLSQIQVYAVAGLSVTLPLIVLWLYLRKRRAGLADLGLGPKPPRLIKPVLRAFGQYLLTALVIMLGLSLLSPDVDLDQAQELGLGDSPQAAYEYLSLFLLLLVLTPLSEEILFRGFMLKGLASRFGWSAAAVGSSLLFGLAHGQLNVGIDTAILGWYSAQLVIQTGSLWPSIALHALKNSIAFTLVFLTPLVS